MFSFRGMERKKLQITTEFFSTVYSPHSQAALLLFSLFSKPLDLPTLLVAGDSTCDKAGFETLWCIIIYAPSLLKNIKTIIALTALKEALAVASTRQMALLMFTFAQTGFILSMYALVLPTAVGSTAALPNAKSLVGLVGLLVGTGEIVGALSYGFLIKCAPNWSRGFIIIFACICHCTGKFALVNTEDSKRNA